MPKTIHKEQAYIPLSPEQYSEIFDIATEHGIQGEAYIDPDSVAFNRERTYLLYITEPELARLLHAMPDEDTPARQQLQKGGANRFGW